MLYARRATATLDELELDRCSRVRLALPVIVLRNRNIGFPFDYFENNPGSPGRGSPFMKKRFADFKRLESILNSSLFSGNLPPGTPTPVTEGDLPAEVRDGYLNKPCCCDQGTIIPYQTCKGASEDTSACWAACPPNPNVTCQLDGQQAMTYVPGHIGNAEKGDLLLCPATSNGLIGALLGALQPSQHYTHMGIFVDDGYHVRHCTQLRTFKQDVFYDGNILGVAAPTNGLKQDAVRYGWPGTITQSVEDAWVAEDPDHRLSLALDPDPAAHQIFDPVAGECVYVDALSFSDILIMKAAATGQGGAVPTIYPALVVRPCRSLLQNNSWVRPLLGAVADQALQIAGHYRFFAYTNSSIAFDPVYLGPPMFESQVSGGPCNPPSPVTSTQPFQCASFVWTAVQKVIKAGMGPVVLDDDQPENFQPVPECKPTIVPEPTGDQPDPADPPPDGQYSYSKEQRAGAARALFAKVQNEVANQIQAQQGMLTAAFLLNPVEASIVGTFFATLLSVSPTAAATLAAAGLSAAEITALLQVQQIPDTVANQIVNAFANDNKETGEAWWSKPTTGTAVGPDNIVWFWEAPRNADSPPLQRGLYGFNEPSTYVRGGHVVRPTTAWRLSPGPGSLRGTVTSHGKALDGFKASVTIGCGIAETVTSGGFSFQGIPAGIYLAKATATNPANGWTLYGEAPVAIPVFDVGSCVIELLDPDPRFRLVKVQTDGVLTRDEDLEGDAVRNYDPEILTPGTVGPFDGRLAWKGEDKSTAQVSGQWGIGSDGSDTIGKITLTYTWTGFVFGSDPASPIPSNMLQYDILMQIIDHSNHDKVELEYRETGYVDEDKTAIFTHSLDTDEFQPDHFAMKIYISNLRLPASPPPSV